MDIRERAREELESRIEGIENFIAERGLGSSYLSRAKKVQRNINLAIAVGCVVTIAGITVWALSGSEEDED